MGDRHQTTIKVISGHHAAEVISNPKELDVSIGVQQEQLQMWLLQEETCLQQHLAQVEQLFEEVLEVTLPQRSSGKMRRSLLEEATGILPGAVVENRGDAARSPSRLPDTKTTPRVQEIRACGQADAVAATPDSSPELLQHFRWEAQRLNEWSLQHEEQWDQAYSRLKRLQSIHEAAKGKGDEVNPEAERPKITHCIPQQDEGSVCRRIFLLLDRTENYGLGTIISAFMVATILVSTAAFVMESVPDFQERPAKCFELFSSGRALTNEACEPVALEIFSYIEAICIVIFTVECLLRICTSFTEPKYGHSRLLRVLRYTRTTMNLIDLATVVPFYLGLILGDAVVALRVLRLMRVVRLLKLAKHHPGIQLCVEAMVESGLPLAILMFFNIIFGIIFAAAIFHFEGSEYSVDPKFTNSTFPTGVFVRKDPDGQDILTPFRSIPMALWWVFTTTTTVGYGDMAPTSHIGRAVGVLCFYVGIIFLALPIGVLSSNFEAAYARYLERKRKNAPKILEVAEQHLIPTQAKRISMFYELQRSNSVMTSRSAAVARKIFKVLNDPSSSCAARWASYLLTSVILLTAVTMICESMPEFRFVPDACQEILTVENCRPRPADAFYYIEFVSIIIFTIDYILRVCTANSMSPAELGVQYVGEEGVGAIRATWRYTTQWLNLVDLCAIVPFYLEMAGLQLGSSAVIRVLRLIRIFRLLKSPKMRNCVDMIVDIVKDALPGILSVFSLTFLVCVLLASCIYFAEGTTYSVEHFQEMYPYGVYIRPTKLGYEMEVTPFRSIFHSFWWFFTTATTVGYGDDFPTTAMGHVIAVFTFYAGVVLVAIMLTIVGGAFQNHYPRFKRWMEQENRRQAMEAEKEVVIGKTRPED